MPRIKIKNRKGSELSCFLDFPEDKEGRLPAVLLVHGFKGDSTQRHISTIAKSIVEKGFVCIRPDLTKNPGKSYLEFSEMTYSQELADLEDIFKASLDFDGVNGKRVGISGHSLGGLLAAEIASKFPEIKSLVTLSAVYDFSFIEDRIFGKPLKLAKKEFDKKGWTYVWSKTQNKDLKLNKKFYEDILGSTADMFASKIMCPTLIISSGQDEAVEQTHADEYLDNVSSKNKRMEMIEGSDHNYTKDLWLKQVCGLTSQWFLRTL